MACQYFVGGKFISEIEFKQLLEEGLLDQLISSNHVNIDKFALNQEYIEKAYSGLAIKDVSIPVFYKRPGFPNTERKVVKPKQGENFFSKLAVPKSNPYLVIQESNNQIEAENKKRKESRPKNEFILGVKVGGEFKFGENISLETKQKILSSSENAKLLSELKEEDEGIVYMWVPSAYGFSPIRLYTSFLGQSKNVPQIKAKLKAFFEMPFVDKDIKGSNLDRLSYKVKFIKTEKGVKVNILDSEGNLAKSTTYETLESLEEAVLGKWNSDGDYVGKFDKDKMLETGLLSYVDIEKINGGNYNQEISNNGYIYTDAYSEGGNFFNSSSFSIKLNQIEGIKEDLERLVKDKDSVKDIEQEVENNIVNNTTTPSAPINQDTKENESALNNIPVPEDTEMDEGDFAALMGVEFISGKDGKPVAEKETPPEGMGDDFFDLGDGSNSDFDFDGAKTKLEKTGWSYQKQNKIDLEKELQYIKDKVGEKGLKVGAFKTIASLKKYLPEDVYKQLQEVSKNGKSVRGLFTEAAVFLSERAFEGTGYHEAFHVVFNLSLNLNQRIALLNEAKIKFRKELEPIHGPNPTFIQIEELLADKFQEYVQSKGAPDTSLGARISNYFKALFRKLQVFFSRNSRININDIFEDINIGVYKNKRVDFSNTDLSKINPNLTRFKLEKQFEGVELEIQAIEMFQHFSFNILDELKKTDPTAYEGLNDAQIINKIGIRFFYHRLLQSLANQGKAVRDRLVIEKNEANKEMLQAIFNNIQEAKNVFTNNGKSFTIKELEDGSKFFALMDTNEFIERFNRTLNDYGIKINFNLSSAKDVNGQEQLEDDLEDAEDTTQNVEERWQRAVAEFNPISSSSQYLRRKLATFTKTNQKGAAIRNSFGAPTYYNPSDVFNFLGKNITDSYSVNDMMEKLKSLRKTKGYMDSVYQLAVSDFEFKQELWIHLGAKTFIEYTLVYEKSGDYRTMAANQKTFGKTVKEKFINEFLTEENTLFDFYPKGHPQAGQRNFEKVKKDAVTKRIQELTELSSEVINSGAKNEADVEKLLKKVSDTFKKSNINFTVEQLKLIWAPPRERVGASFNNISTLINKGIILFQQLENGKNPFLYLTPREFITDKGVLTGERPLESFAGAAFFAFDNELVAAHRNANNKSVYAIQYSHALSKMFSKFKNQASFSKYLLEIKNDPLLSNMPFFKIIADKGKLNSNSENLKFTIFNALSREGKKKSVEYSDLSPIEMVTIQLALFHNNNSKSYSKFTLPTFSDATTMATVQFKKQTVEEVIDNLVETAKAEIQRILYFNSSSENSQLRKIENYKDKAGTFQILEFLQDRVDPETVTDQELKEVITDFLENEFLEEEINKYIEEGVILKYDKETGKITFDEKVVTKSQIGNKEAFFKQWIFNQYFLNTQMTTVLAGDPAQYKSTIDYQKRYKQLISPGLLTNTESGNPTEYSGYIFTDEEVPTKKNIAEQIIKNVKNSNLSENKKKELISLWEKLSTEGSGKSNNTTDGSTFISIDRMVQIYDSLGRMTSDHWAAAERIKQGKELPGDAGMFVILKPFQTTKVYVDGVQINMMFKNSEFVLTKSYAEKSPRLMKAYELLNREKDPVQFIAFESAIKTGKIANSVNSKGKPVYSSIEMINGVATLSPDAELITLKQEDYKQQQETPNKFQDKDGNHGSQIRVLMIADMNMEGDYEIGGKSMKGKEVAQLYQNLIIDNLKESFEEVQNMFLNENGDINYESLVEHLRSEAEDRNLDEDIISALKLVPDVLNPDKKVPSIPLWHPAISYKMESLFNSFFKNRVTKQKINGGSLINVTSYGVSSALEYDATTNTFDALLPLWTKKFFPKTKEGDIDLSKIPEELTKMIAYRIPTEDKYSVFNIKVVGFTDASVGGSIVLPPEATTLAGLDFDIDKLFMAIPNFYLDSEGTPQYLKYLDKESTAQDIVANIITSRKKLEEFLNRYIDKESSEAFLEQYDNSRNDVIELYKERKELFKDQKIKEVIEELNLKKLALKVETNKNKRKALEERVSELYDILSDNKEINAEISEERKWFKEELQKSLINAVEPIIGTIDIESLNSKKSRDNKIIEIMTGIMNNPHTQLSSIDPGNFEKLIEISNELRLLKIDPTLKKYEKLRKSAITLIKKKKTLDIFEYRESLEKLVGQLEQASFNINFPSTQLEIFKRNMTGSGLIGPFANHNTNHAKALFTDLQLAEPFLFDNKDYSLLNQQEVDGNRVSKGLATKLAAVVDNASNPVSSYLNLNMYTVNLIAAMTRLGIQEESIFLFMNQPVIVELTKAYFKERGSVKKEKERINLLRIKWARQLAKKTGITEQQLKEEFKMGASNITQEELYEALMDPSGETFYKVQYNVLKAFDSYFPVSRELGEVVQASRVDTKGVGPTNGDNYAMVNRQEKILNKQNPSVLNAHQLIQEGSQLKMNPAFQKFGWLKPISIMNKIFPAIGEITEYGDINYSILGKIKNFFSDLKDEAYSVSVEEARQIDSHFLTYLMSYSPFFRPKAEDGSSVAFKILEKTPDTLRKYKLDNPESKYIRLLEQLETKDATKKVPFKHISFYNTGRQNSDVSNFKRLWLQMMKDPDETTKQLAFDLVKYTFFTNGFAFGPFTFFGIIPLEFFSDEFARAPENANMGLLDKKGRTTTQGIETALSMLQEEGNIPGNEVENSTLSGHLANRFIRQFAQATAKKSMIIPEVEAFQKVDNLLTDNIVSLKENEVLVLVSGNEGTLNSGDQARIAYDGKTSHNPAVGEKGRKGNFATYRDGVNKISEGENGKSYLIPGFKEVPKQDGTLEDAYKYYKNLNNSNPAEYEKLRKEQYEKLKTSLTTLIDIAIKDPQTNFLINDLRTPFNFSSQEIRQLLTEIDGIPFNVKLVKDLREGKIQRNYEIRNKKITISKQGDKHLLSVNRRSNGYLRRKGNFPTYLTAKMDKHVLLFTKVTSTDNGIDSEIMYVEIPTTGVTNFALQYDINNPIQENVTDKLSKKLIREIPTSPELQFIEDEAAFATQDFDPSLIFGEASTTKEKKETPSDTNDPLGLLDAATSNKLSNLVDSEEGTLKEEIEDEDLRSGTKAPTPSNLTYGSYLTAFNSAVKNGTIKQDELITPQGWDILNPESKEYIISCL